MNARERMQLHQDKVLTPDWGRYMGNNHHTVPHPYIFGGGGVSFTKFIGKPLSDNLWEMLLIRLGVKHIQIFKPRDGRWCIGPSPRGIDIDLDEDGNVKEMYFVNDNRPLSKKDNNGNELSPL